MAVPAGAESCLGLSRLTLHHERPAAPAKLGIGRLRHVEIQVMPTDREDHTGLSGSFRVLKLRNGTTVGYTAAQLHSRVISDPQDVLTLEMRYGRIRAQALSPRESRDFIEKVWREQA
nr:DUF5753 domain-containing protein [Streptomyces sp. A144]